jgi:hypothetical protein
MYAWFVYRMRAARPEEVVLAIDKNATQIRRPGSGHAYGHLVVNVSRFDPARGRVVELRDAHFDARPDAFWHALTTEAAVLDLVRERRRRSLFGSGAPADAPLGALLAELAARYAPVWDRAAERALLREGEARVAALAPTLAAPEAAAVHDRVAVWKWTKRHTSATSFPFLRPGIDVYKADGFDLGGDEAQPRWYAIAGFHY